MKLNKMTLIVEPLKNRIKNIYNSIAVSIFYSHNEIIIQPGKYRFNDSTNNTCKYKKFLLPVYIKSPLIEYYKINIFKYIFNHIRHFILIKCKK